LLLDYTKIETGQHNVEYIWEGEAEMDQLKTGEVISKRRKKLGLTQNQLAAALNTTVDALLGYSSVLTDYDNRYNMDEYYWGLCLTASAMTL
jgi:ribosome-binding protein aMBF1 (putative translation factor)